MDLPRTIAARAASVRPAITRRRLCDFAPGLPQLRNGAYLPRRTTYVLIVADMAQGAPLCPNIGLPPANECLGGSQGGGKLCDRACRFLPGRGGVSPIWL